MRPLQQWNLSAMTIGGLAMLWGYGVYFLSDSSLRGALMMWEVDEFFCISMMLAGFMCICGSVFSCRRARHWGLQIIPFLALPLAMLAFSEGLFNTVTISLPWIGLMALVIHIRDSQGKPRT